MTRTKEHSKQSNTDKNKFIYQQVHKKEILQNITNILMLLVKYSSVYVCVCVCACNLHEYYGERLNIKMSCRL